MKILLTGSTGFLGSHLRARLEKDGHELILFKRGNYAHCFEDREIDVIINAAAELDKVNDELSMFDTNVYLVRNLLLLARRKNTRFIQIGSSSETGPIEGLRSEETPCRPNDLYATTKLVATYYCLGLADQFGLDVCVARPFTIYGSNDKPRKMLPTLWRAWLEGKTFHCYPGGHDWTHVDDFVEGICLLLVAPAEKTKGQIYHFGTGINTSNEEIVRLFEKSAGSLYKIQYHKEKLRSFDVMDWRADNLKARTRLGWEPKVSVAAGVHRFVMDEWFKHEASPGL